MGIMVAIVTIIFFFDSDKVLVIYKGGSITKSEFFDETDQQAFSKLDYTDQIEKMQKWIIKTILFKQATDYLIFQDSNLRYELEKIRNDEKLARVFNFLSEDFFINDSLLHNTIEAAKKQYTIQDIVVTHTLSYSQNQLRTRSDAEIRAETILSRLNSNKITFDEAVSIYTEQPSMKINNGEIGPISFGTFPLSLDSVIWNSKQGQILGPVDSKFGFHIIKVLSITTNDPNTNPRLKKKTIKQDIERGKYGLRDAHANNYAEEWLTNNNVEFYYDNIGELWKLAKAEDLFIIPDGIPLFDISTLNYIKPLARLSEKDLAFDWFLEKAYQHGKFQDAYFVKGYYLFRFIKDLIIRDIAAKWFDNLAVFDHKATSVIIENKQKSFLLKKHIEEELKKDSKLTDRIIINRFLINYNVQINY